jgi:hypothetical protein
VGSSTYTWNAFRCAQICFTGVKSWTAEAPVSRMRLLVDLGQPGTLLSSLGMESADIVDAFVLSFFFEYRSIPRI